MKKSTIHSLGHSVKSSGDFVARLKEHEIELLVDVRSVPYSRFNPQYRKEALMKTLEDNGIEYQWRGNNLGGKGENVEYEETIDELSKLAKKGKRICVMCSEGYYKKCHRHQTLEPSFNQRNITINHIQWK